MAKQKAVQRVYGYLSGNGYNNKINDVVNQLMDLGKDLKVEITSHKRIWQKRYHLYEGVFIDISTIDYKLKDLVQNRIEEKQSLLMPSKNQYIKIDELEG
ncbi:MAG: hypothetical protein WDA22_01505 [Bacteroidota bacterium]